MTLTTTIRPFVGRCIQSVNYKEGGVAMGDQPATPGAGGNGYGYTASEVPELERKEFITKVPNRRSTMFICWGCHVSCDLISFDVHPDGGGGPVVRDEIA